MSKNAKKKPASKPVKKASKPAAKPAKSAAKPAAKKAVAKPAKAAAKAPASKANPKSEAKSLTKSVVSAVGKLFSGKEKPAAKTAAPMPAPVKKEKMPKKPKGKGKKKDQKDGSDFEEDLLASDEEIGSEEIPDLSEFDENEVEEVENLDIDIEEIEEKPVDDEIYLTDAEGRRYCRVKDCDQISSVEGYCRYHYLLLWKRIQVRRKILVDGKLERYVEELTSRYPDKFLEMIRKDLRSEKDFVGAIAELEIDESANENDMEDETQSFIDEVRGITTDTGTISDDDDGF